MTLYRFEQCELDSERREIRVNGILRRVEPKVFDLLCHLALNPRRVLRKEELTARFWPDTITSESTLARAVMKARVALDGTKAGGRVLRTVHRVGYRLDADVACFDAHPSLHVANSAARPPRIGLLPVRVGGAAAGTGWVELTLHALLTAELAGHRGLHVSTPEAVLHAVSPYLRAGESEQAMSVNAGVEDQPEMLLEVTLAWEGERWHGTCYALGGPSGLLTASGEARELFELAVGLASGIVKGLDGSAVKEWLTARRRSAGPLQFWSADARPSAGHLLLLRSADWRDFMAMLQSAVCANPRAARLADACAKLQVMANHPSAAKRVQQLLSGAERAGQLELAARAHHALSRAQVHLVGVGPQSRHHLERAIELAQRAGATTLVLNLRGTLAHQMAQGRNFAAARSLYLDLLREHGASCNRAEEATILHNLAVLEATSGNPLGARVRMERALRVARQAGLADMVVICTANLAQIESELGCMESALELCRHVLGQLSAIADRRSSTGAAVTMALVMVEAGDREGLNALVAHVDALVPGAAQPLRAAALVVGALRDASHGVHHAAHTALRESVRDQAAVEESSLTDQWLPLWLRAAIRCGDRSSAEQARAAIVKRLHSPSLAGDPPDGWEGPQGLLAGALSHARAADLYAQGDSQTALTTLREALTVLPFGTAAAKVQLDMIWLLVESDELAAARALLNQLRTWQVEHPLGLLIHARLMAQKGCAAEAAAVQQQLLAVLGDCAEPCLWNLLSAYQTATDVGGSLRNMRRLPRLPSFMLP